MTRPPGAPVHDADHWDELQKLFDRLERTPNAQRQRELEIACPDPRLRGRVLDLLQASDAMQEAKPGKRLPSTFVGPYRLVREIGAGGNGAVYLAEKWVDGVCLRAALKVLAPHAVDASFVERFYREQQHLAALDHPNITRLLDAGWDDGQPYLVMEYVEGAHLDDYCDRLNLGLVARLGFFLNICDAVSDAHRSLIVHLDLKPSNILISTTGVAKLLDFGTSKLIRPDGDPTSTVMMSPAYASPEQLLSEPVSTASDIYGLGAILFELLSGRSPFGKASASARIEAAAREIVPEPLTRAVSAAAAGRRGMTENKLREALRGDLSAIVAACLRRRPRDRYTSVEALAEEIRRYLSCKPVLARRQTLRYAAGKFFRRHRTAAIATCGVAVVMAVSLAYAAWQQQQALNEAERSVRMQTLLFGLFKMANPNYLGKPVATVPEFLRAGMSKLPDYIREPSDLRAAQLGLAESMFESGDYPGARGAFHQIMSESADAGDTAGKVEAQVFASAVEFQDGNIAAGRALAADALQRSSGPLIPARVRVLSEIYFAFNEDNNGFKTDGNLQLLKNAVRECRTRHLPDRETALALKFLASDLELRGLSAEAKSIFQELLVLYSRDALSLCDRSDVYGHLAWIDDTTGDVEASVSIFRKAYEGYVACAGADSRGALSELPYWADALTKTGRAAEAVTLLENAMPTWRRVAGHTPDQSDMLYFMARAYVATARYAEAEVYANELMAMLTGNLAPESRDLGVAHLVLGQAQAAQHRYREAQPHAQRAVQLLVGSAVSDYGRRAGEEATALEHQVATALAQRAEAEWRAPKQSPVPNSSRSLLP